jgi:hypothetical protein
MEIIINILSSKRLTILVLLSWLLTIFFALWYVHPRVDDGIYLIPAISTFQINFPGVNFSNSIEPVFFILPTQPYLHGIFLKLFDFFFIDINLNTYRIFNYLCVMTLFYVVYKLFSNVFINTKYKIFSFNLSLVLLGFSQFSLQFYINRPEIPGLIFLMLGIYYFVKLMKNNKKRKFNTSIFSFSLGISSIFHPNLSILSILILGYCSYLIISNFGIIYLKYLASFFMPIFILLIWFLENVDAVQGQLFNRVQEVSSFSMPSINNILSTIAGDKSLPLVHNLYLAAYMLTLLISLLVLIFYIYKGLKADKKDSIEKVFIMLGISILIILIIMQPFRPYYLLVSFLSVISISFFITKHLSFVNYVKSANQEEDSRSSSARSFLFIPLILLPLSFPISHTAKISLSNEVYDNHHNTISVLEKYLIEDSHFFITSAQLLPIFTSSIVSDFKTNMRKIHWYFPVADSPGPRFKKLFQDDISSDYQLMSNAIWGALNRTVVFNDSKSIACLRLKGEVSMINLYNPVTIFKDRNNIFLTSSTVVPSNKCFNQ